MTAGVKKRASTGAPILVFITEAPIRVLLLRVGQEKTA